MVSEMGDEMEMVNDEMIKENKNLPHFSYLISLSKTLNFLPQIQKSFFQPT